jgi:hypothetical protein
MSILLAIPLFILCIILNNVRIELTRMNLLKEEELKILKEKK